LSRDARDLTRLLPFDTDHRCTGAHHVEFARRCTAQIDYSTTAVRTTIRDSDNHRLAIAHIRDKNLGAKWQRAMGSG
jgi:hypothetical protein